MLQTVPFLLAMYIAEKQLPDQIHCVHLIGLCQGCKNSGPDESEVLSTCMASDSQNSLHELLFFPAASGLKKLGRVPCLIMTCTGPP